MNFNKNVKYKKNVAITSYILKLSSYYSNKTVVNCS